jgi:glycosyltransferase involved in cell wall biosynthesis
MNTKKVLVIGLVWPEPTSSAAGTRMIQLITLFLSQQYEVTFVSAASKSDFSFNLKSIGVIEKIIKLNDSDFNTLLKELNPDFVLFDRYMIEEQYGWRVHQECPTSVKILDTEDLHSLRNGRQQAVKANEHFKLSDVYNDMAKREIASILRCDLSLIISEIEMDILENQFHVHESLLHYLPFLEESLTDKQTDQWKNFSEREGFVFIGNFLHEPNWNTLQVLKNKIWPVLRLKLPGVKIHIYGAYSSLKVLQQNNARENFLVHGRAADAREAISRHRVLIAPILFGAGVKGKFIDAMQTGTPSVTTTVGSEAMNGEFEWNGFIEDNLEAFVEKAVKIYQDEVLWLQYQKNGIKIINERYSDHKFAMPFIRLIGSLLLNLNEHRNLNFFGQILQHHSMNSTKYMSLWIEEKNSKNTI